LRRFAEEPLLKVVVHPRLGNYSGTISGADLFLIPLDQEIDGRGIDITFLEQNGLKRTDAQFRFRQVGMFVIVRHRTSLADPGDVGKMPIPVPILLSVLSARHRCRIWVICDQTGRTSLSLDFRFAPKAT
jgi:hypothetical protein